MNRTQIYTDVHGFPFSVSTNCLLPPDSLYPLLPALCPMPYAREVASILSPLTAQRLPCALYRLCLLCPLSSSVLACNLKPRSGRFQQGEALRLALDLVPGSGVAYGHHC